MPKKAQVEQEQLFETDAATPRVKRAASAYKTASEEKSKASAQYQAKKDALITLMIDDNVPVVFVELGGVRKAIRLTQEDKLRIEPTAKPPEAGTVSE